MTFRFCAYIISMTLFQMDTQRRITVKNRLRVLCDRGTGLSKLTPINLKKYNYAFSHFKSISRNSIHYTIAFKHVVFLCTCTDRIIGIVNSHHYPCYLSLYAFVSKNMESNQTEKGSAQAY